MSNIGRSGQAFFDESANGIRAAGTVIDITARKNIERRLSDILEHPRGIGHRTADAFYAKDLASIGAPIDFAPEGLRWSLQAPATVFLR